jgi:hypothetical protein
VAAGDFRQTGLAFGELESLETVHQTAKARRLWAFLLVGELVSPTPQLPGWSERIQTRAFPIEPGLCMSFPEFWEYGERPRLGVGGWLEFLGRSLWLGPTNGYANIFGPISPPISMIKSAGMLFLRAADRIASGLGAS